MVVELTPEAATIRTKNGSLLSFYKPKESTAAVPIWEAS
jgi:hypothetical protein